MFVIPINKHLGNPLRKCIADPSCGIILQMDTRHAGCPYLKNKIATEPFLSLAFDLSLILIVWLQIIGD